MRWRLALAGFALAWQIKAEDVPIRLRRPPGAITRFPGSMVDPALGLVKDTIKLAVKLKKALDAIRANDVECQNLQVLVAILIVILLRFENRGLMSHPAICTAALLWLRGSFYSALRQVTKWQRRKKPLRILTARNMAKQLSRVHNEIQQKMQLGSFAFTASILEITVETRYNGAHPPLTQPQLDAAGMENYSSNSTVAAGAGYPVEGLNEIITMLTTGTEYVQMADLAVGTAWRDARLTTMKKAVRQNNLGCRELESCVVKVSGLLVLLNERTELKRHPVISASLMESLEQARELLTYFQKMNTLRLLLRAEGMANLLRQVQTNIQEKLTLASFAITITLNNSTIHPLATQLEDAGAVDLLSHISHSTFGDARCAVNSEVTTVARSGMRATIAKISRFIRPRTRRRRVAPSSSPLLIEEHPDTPVPAATIGRADDLLPFTSVSMAKPQQSLHSRRPTTSTTGLEAHFFGTPDPLLQQQQVEAALAALMQGLPESASPRPAMVGDHLYAMPDDPLLMRHQQRWHAPGPGWTGFPNRLRHNGQWQPETPPLPAPAAIPARGTATNNEKSVTDEASSSMSIKSGARRVFEKPDEPLLMQHQPEPAAPPATVPVRRRRRTVNVSSVHRAPRHSRMMRRTQPALSSQRWGARALHQLLVVPCALCALVLLACVWALRY